MIEEDKNQEFTGADLLAYIENIKKANLESVTWSVDIKEQNQ